MRTAKKKVRQYVATCRARHERTIIQTRDLMFKENNQNRFKSSKCRSECKGLKIGDNVCTHSEEVADHFRDYFENLSRSLPSSPLSSAKANLPDLEFTSFFNCEDILDTEIIIEEIEGAIITLKLGRSGGLDSLDAEHICYGGEAAHNTYTNIHCYLRACVRARVQLHEMLQSAAWSAYTQCLWEHFQTE